MAPVNNVGIIGTVNFDPGNKSAIRGSGKRSSSQSPQNELIRLTGICFKGSTSKKSEAAKMSKFVARSDFGQEGKLLAVVSNHFKLQVANQMVYHYDVEIEMLRAGVDQPSMFVENLLGVPRSGSGEGSFKRHRKLSYKTNRTIIEQLVLENSKSNEEVFYEVIPVYDGQKNLYTSKPLNEVGLEPGLNRQKRFFVTITEESNRESQYAVNIQYASHIDLNAINLYYKRRATDIPAEAIQALDIILRHGPNLHHIPIGNSLYPTSSESQRLNLGCGRQLAFGHFQSVRPCMMGSMLVIDRTATAFYSSGSVISFVCQVLGGGKQQENNLSTIPSLRDYDRKRVERELKTLQIQVIHLPYKRKYRVLGLTHLPAQEVVFRWERNGNDKGMVTIPDYYKEEYNRTLKYTNMPCIIAGSSNRKKYLPMEMCELVPDQHVRKKLTNDQTTQMIRSIGSQSPCQRFNVIKDSVRSVINESLPYMKEFGIEIKTDPLVVDARVIEAPELSYRGMNCKPREGVWNMDRKRLYDVANLENWIVVNFAPNVSDSDARKFVDGLKNQGKEVGISVDDPKKIARVNCYKPGMLKSIFEKAKATCDILKMILFMIPNDDNLYQEIKLVGDVMQCLPTQCIAERNVKRFNASLLSNVLLKINTKLGGTNAVLVQRDKPAILQRRVMIIGADVTHPAPADKLSSSVAACVGSYDDEHTKYYASIRIQEKCKQEMIKDLDLMMTELLEEYKKQHRSQLPEHIIIYRDGVSEGQFEQVLDHEIARLRLAFHGVRSNYCPKLTFIVVQKRHHTRFMPSDEDKGVGKYKNIPPGTVVDTDVVHPSDFDFFLCSHFGIQGTSRPTHYYVLWDDVKFSADELQKLTYYLCHIYARCTRSISVPAPVQYAHLAAYRARLHIIGFGGSESSGSGSAYYERSPRESSEERMEKEQNLAKSLNESIRVQDGFRKAMYFC